MLKTTTGVQLTNPEWETAGQTIQFLQQINHRRGKKKKEKKRKGTEEEGGERQRENLQILKNPKKRNLNMD